MSWFKTGYSGFNDAIEEEQRNRLKKPPRFWLKRDSEKEIIFIDDKGFQFWEHQYYANGTWMNWETCLWNLDSNDVPDGCPLCDAEVNKYYVTLYTIIDTSEFRDKEGNLRKNVRRLLAVKTDVATAIEKARKRRGSLEGCKYLFYRTTSQTSPGTGSIQEPLGEVDLSSDEFKYKDRSGKIWTPEPYDYETIFAPKKRHELLRMVNAARNEETVSTTSQDEDDIPF